MMQNYAIWASPGTKKKAEFKTENRKVAEFRFKTKNIRSDNGSCLEWRVWLLAM
jgi:hypothetical protein